MSDSGDRERGEGADQLCRSSYPQGREDADARRDGTCAGLANWLGSEGSEQLEGADPGKRGLLDVMLESSLREHVGHGYHGSDWAPAVPPVRSFQRCRTRRTDLGSE